MAEDTREPAPRGTSPCTRGRGRNRDGILSHGSDRAVTPMCCPLGPREDRRGLWTQRVEGCEPGSRLSSDIESAGALTLDFPASKTMRNRFCYLWAARSVLFRGSPLNGQDSGPSRSSAPWLSASVWSRACRTPADGAEAVGTIRSGPPDVNALTWTFPLFTERQAASAQEMFIGSPTHPPSQLPRLPSFIFLTLGSLLCQILRI